MADLIDVQNAIVAIAAQALYPNGIGQASAAGGVPVKVFAGWPSEAQLDADLTAGIGNVTVYPLPTERNTTRYPSDWVALSITPPTITATVLNQTITLGGAISTPQNVALLVGGEAFVYAVQAGDTLTSIATALAALVAASFAGTTSLGAIVTVPAGTKIVAARAGAQGVNIREIRRQEKMFQITIWADSPPHRDAIASVVDIALAAMPRILLADQSLAHCVYAGGMPTDNLQKAKLFRRDLNYKIEFATTQTETDTVIVALQENISNQPDGATAVISSIQINT